MSEGPLGSLRRRVAALEEDVAALENVVFSEYRAPIRSQRKEIGQHHGSGAQLNVSGQLLTAGGFEPGDEVQVSTFVGVVVIEEVDGADVVIEKLGGDDG